RVLSVVSTHAVADPADAAAVISFDDSGDALGASGVLFRWLLAGSPGDYEIRATLVDGATPTSGAALGSWLSLSTDRTWVLARTTVGAVNCRLLIEIRDAATDVFLASGIIMLVATVT